MGAFATTSAALVSPPSHSTVLMALISMFSVEASVVRRRRPKIDVQSNAFNELIMHATRECEREACTLCEDRSTCSISRIAKCDISHCKMRDEHVHVANSDANNHDDDIILDIGATSDVIGGSHCGKVEDIELLSEPIGLGTAGGKVNVSELGSYGINGLLRFSKSLMAPWSSMSLLSICDRLSNGWAWRGMGDCITLVDPSGAMHNFVLRNRLFRFQN